MAQERPCVIFLMEMKNKRDVIKQLLLCLYFPHLLIINPLNLVGSLPILWDGELAMEVVATYGKYVDLICTI